MAIVNQSGPHLPGPHQRLGIPYAHRSVPVEWVKEPFSKKRWAALKKIATKPL